MKMAAFMFLGSKRSSLPSLALTLSILAFVGSAHALQVLKMRDGETVTAKVSLKEVSRLAVDGSRVRSIVGARGDYEVQVDKDIGQVFLRPITGAKIERPINIFVTDDQGRTFGLVLQPEDIPAESVVISPPRAHTRNTTGKPKPYQSEIRDLISMMALNDANVQGYDVSDLFREIPIWNEASLLLERIWVGDMLVGERYSLTNISGQEMRLAEQEFLRRGVLAIAIDNAVLGPNQSTGVYVIREALDVAQ